MSTEYSDEFGFLWTMICIVVLAAVVMLPIANWIYERKSLKDQRKHSR